MKIIREIKDLTFTLLMRDEEGADHPTKCYIPNAVVYMDTYTNGKGKIEVEEIKMIEWDQIDFLVKEEA